MGIIVPALEAAGNRRLDSFVDGVEAMADEATGAGTVTKRARKAVAGEPGEGTVTTTARHKTSNDSALVAPGRTRTPAAAVRGGGAEAVDPAELPVRPGEDPWTSQEVHELHAELISELDRLQNEIGAAEAAITGLMRDSNDGSRRRPGRRRYEEHLAGERAGAGQQRQGQPRAGRAGPGPTGGRRLRDLRVLRPGHRQGPHAGLPPGDALRPVQGQAGTPLTGATRGVGLAVRSTP